MKDQLKQTKQRAGILKVMQEMAEKKYHPTAQEVYEELRKQGVGVWLATVYRNLEKFDELGLVKKIEVPGHSARFDGTVTPHLHIKCVVCGRVDDLPQTAKIDLSLDCKDPCGYKVLEIHAEVLGVCKACQEAGHTGMEQ
jgi:Fur family ferric uptake transcriptional regulator